MNNKRIQDNKARIDKYLAGRSTEEERKQIESWYLDLNTDAVEWSEKDVVVDLLDLQDRLQHIPQKKSLLYRWKRVAAVAALLIAALGIGQLWYKNQESVTLTNSKLVAEAIAPGANTATLHFDGGESIELRSDKDALVTDDGVISYADGTAVEGPAIAANATVATPIGGQYKVLLPDGTTVWLNAASSISYPTTFGTDERRVRVSGEAFLEVAKDAKRPFKVELTAGKVLEVLGTSFNINAYADEGRLVTTLVTGRLKVSNTRMQQEVILVPGQQAIDSDAKRIQVRAVDTDTYTSWKDGVYMITDQRLEQFGKQIERWYNVDVDMANYKETKLSAVISREVNLADMLDAITFKTGIKFKVEGRRVTAMN